ncbi:MAG: oxidoreductase [Thermoleophilia bacterium]|nr:oxidoreductase [Thermoleophilia bacterium]
MTDLELGPLRFGVVGAGRLGLVLGRALQDAGFDVEHVSSRGADGRDRATHVLGVPAYDDVTLVTEQVDCVLICVADDALADVVAQLATRRADASPLRVRYVSTSARGGLAALEPLAAAGHATCVLHPVASVADHSANPALLSGAGAAIGASDDATTTFAHALAHAVGLVPFDLADSAWPIHAAACQLASTTVVAALSTAIGIAVDGADIHEAMARNAYARLAASAVERVARDGGTAALAGPVIRGDANTIAELDRVLHNVAPHHADLFTASIGSAAHTAFLGGRIDMETLRSIEAAITTPPHEEQ